MLTVCHNPAAFQKLVIAHCTDPSSKTCSTVISKAAEAYGAGCLDLPAKAKGESETESYRHYACSGALPALAPLCGSGPASSGPGTPKPPAAPATPAAPAEPSSGFPSVPTITIGALTAGAAAGAAMIGKRRQRVANAENQELREQLASATADSQEWAMQLQTAKTENKALHNARRGVMGDNAALWLELQRVKGEHESRVGELEQRYLDQARAHEVMRNVAIHNNYYREAYDEMVLGQQCMAMPLLCDGTKYPDHGDMSGDEGDARITKDVLDRMADVRNRSLADFSRPPSKRIMSDEEWQNQADATKQSLINEHGEVAEALIEKLREHGATVGAGRVANAQTLIQEAENYGPGPRRNDFEYLEGHKVHQEVHHQATLMRAFMVPDPNGAYQPTQAERARLGI